MERFVKWNLPSQKGMLQTLLHSPTENPPHISSYPPTDFPVLDWPKLPQTRPTSPLPYGPPRSPTQRLRCFKDGSN
ncbi:unnamed protein product, partial [Ilex paraguariensis]